MKKLLAALLPGVALGWLIGLSRSPLLATLVPVMLTALLGALPLARAIRGREETEEQKQQQQTQLGALAAVVVGAALGATLAAFAVSRAVFAPRPTAYEALAAEIKDETLKKKYLESVVSKLADHEPFKSPLQAAANASERTRECTDALRAVRTTPIAELRATLEKLAEGDSALSSRIHQTGDDAKLGAAVEEHCK